MPALETLLGHSAAAVRRRSAMALAELAAVSEEEAVSALVERLLARGEVKALPTLCKVAAGKMSRVVHKVVPELLKMLLEDQDRDLEEEVLVALKSLVRGSGLVSFVEEIRDAVIRFLGDEACLVEEEKMMQDWADGEMDDDGWEEEDGGGLESDEVEEEKKRRVRFAAAKCILALVQLAPTTVASQEFWRIVQHRRRVERDTQVLILLLGAVEALIRAHQNREQEETFMAEFQEQFFKMTSGPQVAVLKAANAAILASREPSECDTRFIASVTKASLYAVDSKESALVMQGLDTLILLLERCDIEVAPTILDEHFPRRVSDLFKCIKMALHALRLCDAGILRIHLTPSRVQVAFRLFEFLQDQVLNISIEQGLKVASISSLKSLIMSAGSIPECFEQVAESLRILVDLLQSDRTIEPILVALRDILHAKAGINFNPIIRPLTDHILNRLQSQASGSKIIYCETLFALLQYPDSDFAKELIMCIHDAIINVLSEESLTVKCLALDILSLLIKRQEFKGELDKILTVLLPLLNGLISNPSADESINSALRNIFSVLSSQAFPIDIYQYLLEQIPENPSESTLSSTADCLSAAICSSASYSRMLLRLMNEIESTKELNLRMVLILCIGFIGRNKDMGNSLDDIFAKLYSYARSFPEKQKVFPIKALGNLVAGHPDRLLSPLLDLLHDPLIPRYLLLQALRELSSNASSSLHFRSSSILDVSPILFENMEHQDENIRFLASECWAKLILDQDFKNTVREQMKDFHQRNEFTRQSLMASLRYISLSSNRMSAVWDELQSFIVMGLEDSSAEVRRHSLLTLSAILKSHGDVAVQLHESVPNLILKATIPLPDLVINIPYGPFNQKKDCGLPVRRAAYQCIETILESHHLRKTLQVKDHFATLGQQGLQDDPEIQGICYNLLLKLSLCWPEIAVSVVDILVDPITKNLKILIKNAKSEECSGRPRELLKSALRLLKKLHDIVHSQHIESSPVEHLYERITKTNYLSELLTEIRAEK